MIRTKKSSKVVVAVLLAVCLVALSVGAALLFHSPGEKLANEKPDPVITAPVENRTLVAEIVGDGQFVANGGAKISVGAPSGMLGVVTKNPLVGQQEAAWCRPVIEVSGRPVFVLPGEIPAYRDLTVGDRGDDVRRLQAALLQCGYQVRVDGTFGERTARALEEMYTSAGYQAVRDPALALTPMDSAPDDPADGAAPTSFHVDTQGQPTEFASLRTGKTPNSKNDTAESEPGTQSKDRADSAGDNQPVEEKPASAIAPRSEIHFFAARPRIGQVAQAGEVVSSNPVVSLSFEGDFFEVTLNPDQKSMVAEGQEITISYAGWQAVAALPEIPVVPEFDDQGNPSFLIKILLPEGAPEDSYGQSGQFQIESPAATAFDTVVPISALSQASDGTQYVMKVVPAPPSAKSEDATTTTEKVTVTVIETVSGYVAVQAGAGELAQGDQVAVGRKTP